ncbi:MAG TPA: HTTM domain-containing protein, partial [Thermomicrobiales bacterium]|nr:HTTM domain-containing protein [Thermomicrobiales bacterium]
LFVNGTETFARLLFLAAMAAAVALILGYRTRIAAILVWVCIVSIQARNPLVLSGADGFLRVLLFWAMFLPLGATWSLDRRHNRVPEPARTWVASVATAALFLQIAFVYLFTAILKSGDPWRTDFTAIWYALGAGHLTTPFGAWLHQFPGLLRVLTVATLAIEVIAPVIAFSPWRTSFFRLVAIGLIAGLQVGIFLTMTIGIFPIVSTLCMVCFVPTVAWDWLERRVPNLGTAWATRLEGTKRLAAGWRMRILSPEGRLGFAAGSSGIEPAAPAPQPDRSPEPPQSPAPGRSTPVIPFAANVVAAVLLSIVLAWNIASVSAYTVPDAARPVAYGLGLYQRWSMFAPRPPGSTQWTVIQGTLTDGTQVNLLYPLVRDDMTLIVPFTWERPSNIGSDYYGSKEWRKYFDAIKEDSGKSERRILGSWLCRTWNDVHDGEQALDVIVLYSVLEPTLPEGETASQRQIKRSTTSC